jgi:predicted DNA-binding transcriptional regulator AlpA
LTAGGASATLPRMADEADRVIGITEAAQVAGVARAAIYQWIQKGWLVPVATTSSRTEVRLSEVKAVAAGVGKGWRNKDKRDPLATVDGKAKAERLEKLLSICRRNQGIGIGDIAIRLGVTHMTAWRDIKELRLAGKLSGNAKDGWVVAETPRRTRKTAPAGGAGEA